MSGFERYIGNARILTRLREKLVQNRFPHSVILSGPSGIGKHTLALMLSKALNCMASAADDFCGECTSCTKIDKGVHPDIQVLGLDEDSSEIKIARIRELLTTLRFEPLEGRRKVYIIDPADKMNTAAANALLKALEEPPANSGFVLVTENAHELLLTVRSRCQIYHLVPLALDEIRAHGIADELLVRWSEGSIGRALQTDVTELRATRDYVLQFLVTAAKASDAEWSEVLATAAEIGKAKNDFPSRMRMASVLVRDLLWISEGVKRAIVNVDVEGELEQISKTLGTDRILRIADQLQLIESSEKNYINRQMLAEGLAFVANPEIEKFLRSDS